MKSGLDAMPLFLQDDLLSTYLTYSCNTANPWFTTWFSRNTLRAKLNTETLARCKQFTNSSNWVIRKPIAIFILLAVTQTIIRIVFYRVSHIKLSKVIWLCWGYIFWFLLIFLVLRVHEIGTFMLNSSIFIFLMLRALYRMICKNTK